MLLVSRPSRPYPANWFDRMLAWTGVSPELRRKCVALGPEHVPPEWTFEDREWLVWQTFRFVPDHMIGTSNVPWPMELRARAVGAYSTNTSSRGMQFMLIGRGGGLLTLLADDRLPAGGIAIETDPLAVDPGQICVGIGFEQPVDAWLYLYGRRVTAAVREALPR